MLLMYMHLVVEYIFIKMVGSNADTATSTRPHSVPETTANCVADDPATTAATPTTAAAASGNSASFSAYSVCCTSFSSNHYSCTTSTGINVVNQFCVDGMSSF